MPYGPAPRGAANTRTRPVRGSTLPYTPLCPVNQRVPRRSNVAEWGFVIGYSFWGTGLFPEAARLLLEFAFDVMGVYRLEARASVPNGRGQGALAKVGAFHEVRMRESFTRNGQRFDQVMWSILADEWRQGRRDQRDLQADQPGRPDRKGYVRP